MVYINIIAYIPLHYCTKFEQQFVHFSLYVQHFQNIFLDNMYTLLYYNIT